MRCVVHISFIVKHPRLAFDCRAIESENNRALHMGLDLIM